VSQQKCRGINQKEFFVFDNTTQTLGLLIYLAPAMLAAVSLSVWLWPHLPPLRLFRFAQAATIFALILSLLATTSMLAWGPFTTPLVGFNNIGFAIRLDALSVIMFWLVAAIGLLVVHFSRNYLDGDPGQARFFGQLCLTISAVLLFVLAGNLLQLVVAWISTSLGLHQLLLFYDNRRGAVLAARKKFIAARLSDICLTVAAVLLVQAFGTGDLKTLSALAGSALSNGTLPVGISVATVLVVTAAALKSAMFPLHGWLLEVMETPTPVSALLHAGLLNAGTFLIVRLGEVIFLFPPALQLLILVGGFTALFASVAMITQSSVKVSLAYSSAAHMGFMLMLCGFGAHSVAIMHLVAHSFYKAHAFLSSGSVVEYIQATGGYKGGGYKEKSAPRPLVVLAALALSIMLFVGIGTMLGIDLTKRPGETALGVIFTLATTALLAKGFNGTPHRTVIVRTTFAAIAVTFAFFTLEVVGAWLLTDAVTTRSPADAVTLTVMGIAVVLFVLVTLLYTFLPAIAETAAGRAMYVHLKHGFYANTLLDRLIGAWR